jgi:hypothetical protein
MNVWLFDFPAREDLVGIMKFVAPAATDKMIMEGAPVEEGIQLRFLYTVQRLQHIFRLNRRAAHVRERVARLESNMLNAQQGYEQRVSQITSPLDHHRTTAELQMLEKYKEGVTQRIHALKTAIKPGAILAYELTKAHLEQTQRALASKGQRESLRPQWLALSGKIKRTKPTRAQMQRYNDIDPKTTRPLRTSKIQGWQPKQSKPSPNKRATMSAAEAAGGGASILHPTVAARAGVKLPQDGNPGMYRDPVPLALGSPLTNDYRAFAMQPGAAGGINPMMLSGAVAKPPGVATGAAAAAAYKSLALGGQAGAAGAGPWQGNSAAQMFRATATQPAVNAQQRMMAGAGLQALANTSPQGGAYGMAMQPQGPSTRMFREDAWQQQGQGQTQYDTTGL